VALYNWINHEQNEREEFTLYALKAIYEKLAIISEQQAAGIHNLVVVDLHRINGRSQSQSEASKNDLAKDFRQLWEKIDRTLKLGRASLAFTSCKKIVAKQLFSCGLPDRFVSSDLEFICYGHLSQFLYKIEFCKHAQYGSKRLASPSITKFLRERLANKIRKFEGWEPLRSTPVDATGFLNAAYLIGDPEVFPWLIFELAKRLDCFKSKNDDPLTLVALSRNGTVLARAISRFTSAFRVNVIDHLAPAAHAVESYHHPAPPEHPTRQRFLFVGDVLIAGTEYRMCQAYATICNADFEGAVFICAIFESVQSLLKPRGDEDRAQRIEALFNLLELGVHLTFRFPIQNYSNSGSDEVEGFTFKKADINILTIAWDDSDLAKVFRDIDDVQTSAEKSLGKLRATHVVPPTFGKIQEHLSFDEASKGRLKSFQVVYVAAHGDGECLEIDYKDKYKCSLDAVESLVRTYVDKQEELISKK
jgi:hypothetical protein